LDVFLEDALVPGDAGVLVGLGVVEALGAARVAAVETVKLRPDLVLRALSDRMAREALLERLLAGGNILRRSRGGRGRHCECRQNCSSHHASPFRGLRPGAPDGRYGSNGRFAWRARPWLSTLQVPRTRSSHPIAASPIANFGFKAALES